MSRSPKRSTVCPVRQVLEEQGCAGYSIIVPRRPLSDPAPIQYIAPFTVLHQGRNISAITASSVIIYDDLSSSGRLIADGRWGSLLRRPPGREAYPGDVFYLHSRLGRAASERQQGSVR